MKLNLIKVKSLKFFITSFLFTLFLTACSNINMNIDGSNNFQSLVSGLVESSYKKIQKRVSKEEVILVSDFVNIDKLENHSKLGFLLSETLKNSLSSKNIIIREVELMKNFKIGEHGFNVLSRNQNEVYDEIVDANLAMVGTYSITSKRLIVFIKLIDIHSGHILSSSSNSVMIDDEISELENVPKKRITRTIYAPATL